MNCPAVCCLLEEFIHKKFESRNKIKELSQWNIDERIIKNLKDNCCDHFLTTQTLDLFEASFLFKKAKDELESQKKLQSQEIILSE